MISLPEWELSTQMIVPIPPEARNNTYLKPFTNQILKQEQLYIEKAKSHPKT
jgi:hypothetical protein